MSALTISNLQVTNVGNVYTLTATGPGGSLAIEVTAPGGFSANDVRFTSAPINGTSGNDTLNGTVNVRPSMAWKATIRFLATAVRMKSSAAMTMTLSNSHRAQPASMEVNGDDTIRLAGISSGLPDTIITVELVLIR